MSDADQYDLTDGGAQDQADRLQRFSGYAPLMKKLGKYKTGKSCLYLKRLEDVDQKILRQLIARSVADMKKLYECT